MQLSCQDEYLYILNLLYLLYQGLRTFALLNPKNTTI